VNKRARAASNNLPAVYRVGATLIAACVMEFTNEIRDAHELVRAATLFDRPGQRADSPFLSKILSVSVTPHYFQTTRNACLSLARQLWTINHIDTGINALDASRVR
jgi:hypothetical protein